MQAYLMNTTPGPQPSASVWSVVKRKLQWFTPEHLQPARSVVLTFASVLLSYRPTYHVTSMHEVHSVVCTYQKRGAVCTTGNTHTYRIFCSCIYIYISVYKSVNLNESEEEFLLNAVTNHILNNFLSPVINYIYHLL
jgi:hypothetical protein